MSNNNNEKIDDENAGMSDEEKTVITVMGGARSILEKYRSDPMTLAVSLAVLGEFVDRQGLRADYDEWQTEFKFSIDAFVKANFQGE